MLGAFAYMPVSLVVLIFYTFPLLTGLFASLLDRRWPRGIEIVRIVVAFFGLALALDVSLGSLHPIGLGLSVLAALIDLPNLARRLEPDLSDLHRPSLV